MEDHTKTMLQIEKQKPGKISLKKSRVVLGPDILVIRNKLAVISIDVRDPETNLIHTDGAIIFHNPPNEEVIEQLYVFIMIADRDSIPITHVPE